VLGIETSTYSGSVAIIDGDTIVGEIFLNVGPSHSDKLLPMVDWLLREAGMKRHDIDGIAVSNGPGSFTSLRVGISTAKGIAYSLGIPVVGVSSLKVLSRNLLHTSYEICTLIDARRKEAYAAFFKSNGDDTVRLKDDCLINPVELIEMIGERTIFIGNGVVLYRDLIEKSLGDLAIFCTSNFNFPKASHCAQVGINKLNSGHKGEIFQFSPQYLSKADAEISKER
ncbi:MAG: tRNA (adenosine(37)-N6)-threonylcarbamoyltransferase complex dimerization subunit type 1 TsaB, partial [Deltaproteobacteria bacterium]|nr:tRNA (adenosine(37)-N6)-threonylcarbamoyltransferase complex dimerization subunit type 1 TsaB [Deltaproteobacteria bacterium]